MSWHNAADAAAKRIVSEVTSTLKFAEPVRVSLINRTWVSNLLTGAGVAYAIDSEKSWQAPIAWFTPSAYAGYHLYKNRAAITREIKSNSSNTLNSP